MLRQLQNEAISPLYRIYLNTFIERAVRNGNTGVAGLINRQCVFVCMKFLPPAVLFPVLVKARAEWKDTASTVHVVMEKSNYRTLARRMDFQSESRLAHGFAA